MNQFIGFENEKKKKERKFCLTAMSFETCMAIISSVEYFEKWLCVCCVHTIEVSGLQCFWTPVFFLCSAKERFVMA